MRRSAFLIFLAVLFVGCKTTQERTVKVPLPTVQYSDAPSRGIYGPAAAEKRLQANRIHTKSAPSSQIPITYGTTANDGTGMSLRNFSGAVQTNFTEIYANVDGKVAITNGSAVNLTVAGGNVTAPLTNVYARVPNILFYGAVAGSGDDYSAFTNAQARAGDIVVPAGIFDIASDLTISQTNNLVIEDGAVIRLATNVTLTVRGALQAPMTQWIDTTSWVEGKGVIFPNLGIGSPMSRVPAVWLDWWGSNPNNSSLSSTKAMKAWAYSTPAGFSLPHRVMQGIYLLNDPILVSNQWKFEASGQAQINFAPTNSSVGAFKVVGGGNDVLIKGFVIGNGRTSATNTFTNLFAIKVSPDVDRLVISENFISGFNGGGIYMDGGALSEGILYPEISRNRLANIKNSTANGGNGLTPAVAVVVTNTVTTLSLIDNKVLSCDMAYLVRGTNMGHIQVTRDTIESCGLNGVTASNTMEFAFNSGVGLQDIYMEGNLATFGIWGESNKTFTLTGKNTLNADLSGIVLTKNSIGLKDVAHAQITANFNNTTTNFISQFGSGFVVVRDSWFDLGFVSSYLEISGTNLTSRLLGNIIVKGRETPRANTIAAVDSSGKIETFKESGAIFSFTKAERNALTAVNGMVIYQTDNTPGIRNYENGAWVRPTVTADP